MSLRTFDPYHKWLGIPPEEQPPNYYRLLGIRLFEADRDVISHAADQRMIHVRSFQAGKNGKSSQQLLNELAAARICLLKIDKKAEYDAELRAKLAIAGRQEASPPVLPSPPGFSHASPPPPPAGFGGSRIADSYPAPSPGASPLSGLGTMPVPAGASPLAPAASMFDQGEHEQSTSGGSLDDVLSAPRSYRSTTSRGSAGRRSNSASLGITIAVVSIIVLGLIAGGIAYIMNSSQDSSDDGSSTPAPIVPEPRHDPHKSSDQKTTRPDIPIRGKPGDSSKPVDRTPDGKRPPSPRHPLDQTGTSTDHTRPAATPPTPGNDDESPEQMDLKKSLEQPPK